VPRHQQELILPSCTNSITTFVQFSHRLEEPRTSQMSRPLPFQRNETQVEEVERVPLATDAYQPEWPDEHDLGDEPLPSYSEAVAQRGGTRPGQRRIAPPPPFEQMARERPTQRRSLFNNPLTAKKPGRLQLCLIVPIIALFIGAIFRFLSQFYDADLLVESALSTHIQTQRHRSPPLPPPPKIKRYSSCGS
jgi:hypothetical protein